MFTLELLWTLTFAFQFLVSLCLSAEMENWRVISKAQMEPLVYSGILYTKWSYRRLKICKGLPKIQTHYSFQQIWQILNYINFWTFFFSSLVLTEVNLKIQLHPIKVVELQKAIYVRGLFYLEWTKKLPTSKDTKILKSRKKSILSSWVHFLHLR